MTTEKHTTTNNDPFHLYAPTRPADMPTAILHARAGFLQEAVLHVLQRIAVRRQIRDANLARLDDLECQLGTHLLELPHFTTGWNKDLDALRVRLEKDYNALEMEKGREEAAFFKDTAQLQTDLITWVRELRGITEKLEVMNDKHYPAPSFQDLLRLTEAGGHGPEPDLDGPPSAVELAQLKRIP